MLRGFDAGHGTDVALFVDGVPVNLRTHAHGQGYADLHFLIPETIKQVDAFEGPYYVEYGDFATAATIDFVTLDTVPDNFVEAAGGSFGTQRYLTLFSPTRDRVKTLFALEAYTSEGPFNRYADESRQQTARGYTLFDLSARYRYKNLEAFLSVENLANAEWREAQFFFDSRLPGEPASDVPDIHDTPGNPRTFLGGVAIRF
jgi:outer membrane receptor protein involved in Fe transport